MGDINNQMNNIMEDMPLTKWLEAELKNPDGKRLIIRKTTVAYAAAELLQKAITIAPLSANKISLDNFYKLGIQYESESSENLEQLLKNNIETFSNNFYGIYFSFTKPRNDVFYFNKFHFEINPLFGRRKTASDISNQLKIKTNISYIWDINPRNSLYIRNETGYLNSNTYFSNELFRIGGANSIRGFNEQSIFTESFTFFNIEYRILTNSSSYLYTITDFGQFSIQNKQKSAVSFGIGYFFNTKNSQININGAVGKNSSNTIDFKQVKLTVNWKSFF